MILSSTQYRFTRYGVSVGGYRGSDTKEGHDQYHGLMMDGIGVMKSQLSFREGLLLKAPVPLLPCPPPPPPLSLAPAFILLGFSVPRSFLSSLSNEVGLENRETLYFVTGGKQP